MKKIISLFARNYEGDRLVRNEVVPGAEWVINGEGRATRKFDGACCMIKDGKFYKRYDAKKGRIPPLAFEPAQEAPDSVTGHWPGWLPVGSGPEDAWFLVSRLNYSIFHGRLPNDGTYEAVGPHFQGNPEGFSQDILEVHGAVDFPAPRTFEELRQYLSNGSIEGIVWHHPDGRMVKIKAKDFGFSRKRSNT